MSIYRPPDPPVGPDRPSDAYPLTDAAEVAEARRVVDTDAFLRFLLDCAENSVSVNGPEQFATHEEYQAARELEEWGCNPFEEE